LEKPRVRNRGQVEKILTEHGDEEQSVQITANDKRSLERNSSKEYASGKTSQVEGINGKCQGTEKKGKKKRFEAKIQI